MYENGKTYKVIYFNKDGEVSEDIFTPETDMNIAGVINYFKDNKEDFFKLVEITEEVTESKEIKTESEEVKTLYELIVETGTGIDVIDSNDVEVYVEFDPEAVGIDPYDSFISEMCKQLYLQSYSDTTAEVDFYKFVENNFDIFDELFDVSGDTREEEIANIVCDILPDVISGYTTDSVYKELDNKMLKECKLFVENAQEGQLADKSDNYIINTINELCNIIDYWQRGISETRVNLEKLDDSEEKTYLNDWLNTAADQINKAEEELKLFVSERENRGLKESEEEFEELEDVDEY